MLQRPKSLLKILIPAALGGVFLAAITMTAFFLGYSSHDTTRAATDERYKLLSQAQDDINQYFIHTPPAQTQLEYSAIRGLIAALNDKYTFFVEAPVAQSESNVLAGQYGGIGVQLQRDEAGNFVLYPFPDSPAAKAGVQNGDVLLNVNGKDVPITTQQDAVDQLLRGEVKDTNGVTFTVRHQPSAQQQTFTVVFAVIDVPSVAWRVLVENPAFGYVQIMRFTARTPDELKNALTDLKSKKVTGLILDLRNNPGGLLDESIKVTGQFLNGGVVLIEKSRTDEKIYNAPEGQATDLPMVVLVNGGTASAAELVAGALHDRQRGLVVGQQTYGKGSVQLIFDLADHSSIHVTTAEWLPPSRTPLNGKGLTPDVPMIADPTGRDVELGEAIRQLQKKLTP